MIANNIKKDIPRGKRKRCPVCFKSTTFVFDERKHIQINKRERSAKLQWYCPLADSQVEYDKVMEQKTRNRKETYCRYNKKRKGVVNNK